MFRFRGKIGKALSALDARVHAVARRDDALPAVVYSVTGSVSTEALNAVGIDTVGIEVAAHARTLLEAEEIMAQVFEALSNQFMIAGYDIRADDYEAGTKPAYYSVSSEFNLSGI